MKKKHITDETIQYINILADITLGKKLAIHYQCVSDKIDFLNKKIENYQKLNLDHSGFAGVCDHYCRLKDLIISEMK